MCRLGRKPLLRRPVFIVGCGRSGTTILGETLAESTCTPKRSRRLTVNFYCETFVTGRPRLFEKLPINSFRLPFLDALPAERHISLTYEELLDRPVEVVRRIEEFAGLAPSKTVHEFAEANLQRRSAKIDVTHLSDVEERLAGDLMRRLGCLATQAAPSTDSQS